MRYRFSSLAMFGAAALLASCGEPVDSSQARAEPADTPPPAVEPASTIVAAAPPLQICLNAAEDETAQNECYVEEVGRRDQELELYLGEVSSALGDNSDRLTGFNTSQAAWSEYRDQYCDGAVGAGEEDGRENAVLACRSHMIADRTHQIWSDFLREVDGGPAAPQR